MIRKAMILCVVLAACGKDEGKPAGGGAPATTPEKTAEQLAIEKENQQPPMPKPAPAASPNDVDLTFEGAFAAKLTGKAGMCSVRKSGPLPGATWQVRSEELGATPDFDLTIISEEKSFDDPSIIVNVKGDARASYGRHRGGKDAKLVVARDGTSAELDVILKKVAAAGEDLHVTGTIRCPAPSVHP